MVTRRGHGPISHGRSGRDILKEQFGQNVRGGGRFADFDTDSDEFAGRANFRAKRGQVESTVLEILLDGEATGYEIIATIEKRSGGLWKPSAGSIYPKLEKMAEAGLIDTDEEFDNKNSYTLTDEGKARAEKAKKANASFWKRAEALKKHGLKEKMAFAEIMTLVKQIHRTGDDTQKAELSELVADVKAQLEEILYSEGSK
jgi:DNA-binding PadR family transcriptional regulator